MRNKVRKNAKKKKHILRLINCFIPKRKNTVYVRCRTFYRKCTSDLINNSSSNLLHFLDAYLHCPKRKKLVVYLEYWDIDRVDLYERYKRNLDSAYIDLHFVKARDVGEKAVERLCNRVLNLMRRLSSNIWLCETGDIFSGENLPCQKVICMNYFIPCKSDVISHQNDRWSYLDGLLTTSMLTSQITSSALGVKFDQCMVMGFPRNDVLFQNQKKNIVMEWIRASVGFEPKYIFLYAPTYRDYEIANEGKTRPLLGYSSDELEAILQENKAVLIYNLHPLQNVDCLSRNQCMLAFEDTYDFTVYDLMSITDCMITDYSSIGYDFLLTDRPIIFNLYDLDLYERKRGLSYDPYVDFCPGHIVTNWTEMKQAIQDVLQGRDAYVEQRQRVARLLHKYRDGHSTERVIQYFETLLR